MKQEHIDEKNHIKLLTNENWTLVDFEEFIHSINNIYYTLYVCNDIIKILKQKDYKDKLALNYGKIGISISIKNKLIKIRNEDLLSIKSIRMESPGEINLWAGSGEVIHELREFIKDISFRNKQEFELGQLNILKKRLEIMQEHGISKIELTKLLLSINDDCLNLINLQNKNLLDLDHLIDFKA
jgi:hypothetical protein